MAASNFPVQIQDELQQGYLEKAYQEPLAPNEAWAVACEPIVLPMHTGDTLTRTKRGMLASKEDSVDPTTITAAVDNGMTNQQWGNEQYTLTAEVLNGYTTVDIKTSPMGIVDRFRTGVKNIVQQSKQSLDKYRRNALLGGLRVVGGKLTFVDEGYAGGTTVVIGAGATGSTSVPVDDVTGFTKTFVYGTKTNVAAQNPMPVYSAAGALIGEVVGFTLDFMSSGSPLLSNNQSLRTQRNSPNGSGYGASGTLIFSSAVTLAAGTVLVAGFGPDIIRPNGKEHFSQLASTDLLNEASILDAVAEMRDANIPGRGPLDLYPVVTSNRAWRQLYSDNDFKTAAQTRIDDPVYRYGRIVEHLGCVFLFSTNAAAQTAGGGLPGIARTMIIGGDALVDGVSAVNGQFANITEEEKKLGYRTESDGIVVNISPPIDALERYVRISWESIRGATVASDSTANGILDTADSAYLKRVRIIEHAA